MSANVTIVLRQHQADHLKLWEDTEVSAPRNELESIQYWLRMLGTVGAEETKEYMRKRLLILMKSHIAITEANAEKEFGL